MMLNRRIATLTLLLLAISLTLAWPKDALEAQTPAKEFTPSSLEGNSWTPERKEDMPTARYSLGVVAHENGIIYAIGGLLGPAPMTNVIEAYDPVGDSWTELNPMPTARHALGVAVADNQRVYAVGGSSDGTGREVEEFNPNVGPGGEWTSKASLPAPRQGLAVAAANGKIYAISGSDQGGIRRDDVYEYNPDNDTAGWISKEPIPTARHAPAVAVGCDGNIYVFGGTPTGSVAPLPAVEVFDPINNTWTQLDDMPNPRSNLAAVRADNCKIYVIGGFNHSTNTTFRLTEEYDPDTDTWIVLDSMPTVRGDLGIAFASNGKIYAIGGRAIPGVVSLETVEEFNLEPTPCALNMGLGYEGDTLAMDFEVGTLEPALWRVWLVVPSIGVIPLWSAPLPAIPEPVGIPISFPFPNLGAAGFLTTLSTAEGITCWDFGVVDTGLPSSSAPSAQELRELLPQPNAVIPNN